MIQVIAVAVTKLGTSLVIATGGLFKRAAEVAITVVIISASTINSAASQEAERYEARLCLDLMARSGAAIKGEAAGVQVIPMCDCVGRYAVALMGDSPNNQQEISAARQTALRVCSAGAVNQAIQRSFQQLQELQRGFDQR